MVQLVTVVRHDLLEESDTGVDRHIPNPEKDDAGVREVISKDEIAKVLVVGEEKPLLCERDSQDFAVVQCLRVVTPADSNVMSLGSEKCNEAEWQPLVEQESHEADDAASFVPLGVTSTRRSANAKQAFTSSSVSLG